MRVDGPDGQRWRIGRRWLPWRPRVHVLARRLFFDVGGDDPITATLWMVANIPCALAFAAAAVEWVLLLCLLPVVVPVRFLVTGWTVAARGRRVDGTRVRYERRAERGGTVRLLDTAVAEIRDGGEPRSLGTVVVTARPKPQRHEVRIDLAMLATATGTVTFEAAVCGLLDTADTTDDHGRGWVEGELVQTGTGLMFEPDWADVDGCPLSVHGPVRLRPAGTADGQAVAGRLVAACLTSDGREIRIAVEPHLGPILRTVLTGTGRAGGSHGAGPSTSVPSRRW